MRGTAFPVDSLPAQKRREGIPFANGVSVQEYLAAEAGLESAALLGCSHWYIDTASAANRPDQWNDLRCRALRNRCDAAAMHPILHGNGQAALGHEIAEVRAASAAYVKREVRLAAELGAPLILHGGPYYATQQYHAAFEQAFSRFLDEIGEVAAFASSHGVEIWVENLAHYARPPFGTICSSVEEMAKVVRISGVKAVLDLGHANIDGGNPADMLSMIADQVACISVSDNDGKSDAHLPPGAGNIDFHAVLQILSERGWRGLINIELHHGETDDVIEFLYNMSRNLEAKPTSSDFSMRV